MTYAPPLQALLHTMRVVGGMDDATLYPALADGAAEAILEEAGKFAAERIAPLNAVGDKVGAKVKDGVVTTPPGWKEAYRDWSDAGWNALAAPEAFGGQGLPTILSVACAELWNSGSVAFALCPLLTAGAIEALTVHGSPELQARYLPNLVSGRWTGTMNLTEPQAGSDLAALTSKAERAGDGSYRIRGTKIYITYGEHDCAENIIHLVLARLPDAPPGTRGISLFLVPKILPDGSRNDLRCHSIEHKLGIHGSPTCTMIFGDAGGATGWLIGEENRGLNCMFTMMNNARLMVAVQGVAVAERATQRAIHYASERRQGRAPGVKEGMSPIIQHPDVKRMLLEMRAKTAAARALCMATAAALDGAAVEEKTAGAPTLAFNRASLLTPLAKAYATDISVEVASIGIQVHGGMGFVEETGAAQHYRDARILPIYEGTNGIQAIDLVGRKLGLEDGHCVETELERCADQALKARQSSDKGLAHSSVALEAGVAALRSCVSYFTTLNNPASSLILAGATPFLRLFACVSAGAYLVEMALAATGTPLQEPMIADCRFFLENEVAKAAALAPTIIESADLVLTADLAAA
jgi:acyl-CoA dehydrogenase